MTTDWGHIINIVFVTGELNADETEWLSIQVNAAVVKAIEGKNIHVDSDDSEAIDEWLWNVHKWSVGDTPESIANEWLDCGISVHTARLYDYDLTPR